MSDEFTPSIEEQISDLRYVRNALLTESDRFILAGNPSQEILDYRQALRDLTENFTSLDDVVYPPFPEVTTNG